MGPPPPTLTQAGAPATVGGPGALGDPAQQQAQPQPQYQQQQQQQPFLQGVSPMENQTSWKVRQPNPTNPLLAVLSVVSYRSLLDLCTSAQKPERPEKPEKQTSWKVRHPQA